MKLSNLIKRAIIASKKTSSLNADRESCIIFGSGPSLDKFDASSSFLQGKDLIGCNFIHQHKVLKDKNFRFFSMIDRDYTAQADKAYFNSLECEHFLVSTKNAMLLGVNSLRQKRLHVVNTRQYVQGAPINKGLITSGRELLTGNSMPFLIQCAAFMAYYKTIYLYGVDHYSFDDLDEESHNFEDYKGRQLKDLTMTRKKLEYINSLYSVVKDLCDEARVSVINITPGSKLEMFEKSTMDE